MPRFLYEQIEEIEDAARQDRYGDYVYFGVMIHSSEVRLAVRHIDPQDGAPERFRYAMQVACHSDEWFQVTEEQAASFVHDHRVPPVATLLEQQGQITRH